MAEVHVQLKRRRECVEVGSAGRVLVRDTQDRSGPVLRFSAAAWRKFAYQVKTDA
jgi:hypothetical protein